MITIDISHLESEQAMWELQAIADNNAIIECQIEFWADHAQSKIVRDFVGYIFDKYSVDKLWRGRFVLITDELINNAIEHGSIAWDLDSCIIYAHEDSDENFSITLEVHDTGKWKDSKDANHMEDIKNQKLWEHNTEWVHMEKRGMGLFYITEKLVDRLSFDESIKGWLAVRVEKNIVLNQ